MDKKLINKNGKVRIITEEEYKQICEEAKQLLEIDISKLIIDKTFMSRTFSNATKKFTTDVWLGAMSLKSKNFELFINPINYLALKTQPERIFLLFHEVMHYISKHPQQYRYLKYKPNMMKKLNILFDLEINEHASQDGKYMTPIKGGVYVDEFNEKYELDMEKNQSWLYYEKFYDQFKNVEEETSTGSGNPSSGGGEKSDNESSDSSSGSNDDSEKGDNESSNDGGGQKEGSDQEEGQNGAGNNSGASEEEGQEEAGGTGDESSEDNYDDDFYYDENCKNAHDYWLEGDTSEEDSLLKDILRREMEANGDDLNKNAGRYPANLLKTVLEIIEDNVNYGHLLANITAKYLRVDRRRTYSKEHTFILEEEVNYVARGVKSNGKKKALVIKDTSGSIGKKELAVINGHIKKLMRQNVDIWVMDADADVQQFYRFNPKLGLESQTTVKGGGGTSFAPPFDYIKEKNEKFDVIIYATDGYAPRTAPTDYPIPTIWVIFEGGVCPTDINDNEVKGKKNCHVVYSKTK